MYLCHHNSGTCRSHCMLYTSSAVSVSVLLLPPLAAGVHVPPPLQRDGPSPPARGVCALARLDVAFPPLRGFCVGVQPARLCAWHALPPSYVSAWLLRVP